MTRISHVIVIILCSYAYGMLPSTPKHLISVREEALRGVKRPLLLGLQLLAFSTLIGPRSTKAAGNFNIREEIARGAAAVPGFGQTDVFSPQSFAGKWRCELEISDVIDNVPEASALLKEAVPYVTAFVNKKPVVYMRSFVTGPDGQVVEDRGFGARSLTDALQGTQKENDARSSWDRSNPNVLTFSTSRGGVGGSGVTTETKVTKRAIEKLDPDASGAAQVGFSEYSRLAELNSGEGIGTSVPTLFGKRVLGRLKEVEPGKKIGGLYRIFYYQADYVEMGGALPQPILTLKSRFTMTRAAEEEERAI
jgi:hypothetical protein